MSIGPTGANQPRYGAAQPQETGSQTPSITNAQQYAVDFSANMQQITQAFNTYAKDYANNSPNQKADLQKLFDIIQNAHAALHQVLAQELMNANVPDSSGQMPTGIEDACSRMFGADHWLTEALTTINNNLTTGYYPDPNTLKKIIGNANQKGGGGSAWNNVNAMINDLGGSSGIQATALAPAVAPSPTPQKNNSIQPALDTINWYKGNNIDPLTTAIAKYQSDLQSYNSSPSQAGKDTLVGDQQNIQKLLSGALYVLTGGNTGNGVQDTLEGSEGGYFFQQGGSLAPITDLERQLVESYNDVQNALLTGSFPDLSGDSNLITQHFNEIESGITGQPVPPPTTPPTTG